MIHRFPILVGVVMAAIVLMAMAEPPAINTDLITVNGRHGLPHGDGSPIGARLLVKEVVIAPSATEVLKTDAATLSATLRQAMEKSLRNHGYLAAPGAEPTLDIVVELVELDLQADALGATAMIRIKVTPTAEAPAIACLPYTATGKFHALTPLKSGGGQRATGIIFGALAGPVGGVFMANQLQNAAANNVALNSRRVVAAGEGVSPQQGAPAVARHAGINALQMTLVDLIKHLGETEGCKAPPKPLQPPSPETAAPEISTPPVSTEVAGAD
jgi:hypothetical protein